MHVWRSQRQTWGFLRFNDYIFGGLQTKSCCLRLVKTGNLILLLIIIQPVSKRAVCCLSSRPNKQRSRFVFWDNLSSVSLEETLFFWVSQHKLSVLLLWELTRSWTSLLVGSSRFTELNRTHVNPLDDVCCPGEPISTPAIRSFTSLKKNLCEDKTS